LWGLGGLHALQSHFFSGVAQAAPAPPRKREILGRQSLPKPRYCVK
jgi:hypothetical protein